MFDGKVMTDSLTNISYNLSNRSQQHLRYGSSNFCSCTYEKLSLRYSNVKMMNCQYLTKNYKFYMTELVATYVILYESLTQ